MSAPLRRKQTQSPVTDVAQQLEALVEALVELVSDRVADRFPTFGSSPARAAYTVREFAELVGSHPDQIYRAINDGLIHSVRLGGGHRIPHAELERLLAGEQRSA